MKMTFVALVASLEIAAATFASAQEQPPSQAVSPAVGIGSKTMDACTADIKKFCGNPAFNLETQKECLVTNWTKISSDCQDAVAKQGRGLRGE
jgi:hypothetical protein